MFKKRFFTTIFLLVWLAASILVSNPFLLILLLFVAMTWAGSEFISIRWLALERRKKTLHMIPFPKISRLHMALGLSYGLNIPLAFVMSTTIRAHTEISMAVLFAWSTLTLLVLAIYFYRTEKSLQIAIDKIINGTMGFVYFVIPGVCALYLSQMQLQGSLRGAPLVFVLGSTAASDIGAYLVGSTFGKSPLLPNVSPTKTIEGSLGGLFVSALVGFALRVIFQLPMLIWQAVFFGFIAGLFGQIGDLFQSALKRVSKVKDSGHMLPGHGGVFDRIDSHLISLPVLYLLFLLISK